MPLFLLRHGQTDWNLAKRFQSRTDVPLNETGLAQARKIGSALARRGLRFSKVSTSPLGRARVTAELVFADLGASIGIDDDLIELALGDFEGRPEAALRTSMGEDFDRWRAACFTSPAPNGESIFDGITRARRALANLVEDPEGHYAIVGHQGINMAMMAALSGRTDVESLTDFRQANDQVEVWDPRRGIRLERFLAD